MEYRVLNNYILIKQLKNMPQNKLKGLYEFLGPLKFCLFLIVIISTVGLVILSMINPDIKFIYFLLFIEITAAIVLCHADMKDSITNSKKSLEELNKKCDETKQWLYDLGFVEKNQIKQLCSRCNAIINTNRNKYMETKKLIDRIFNIFLLPIFVTGVSEFTSDIDPFSGFLITLTSAVMWISLYVAVITLSSISERIINSESYKMERMVRDIQNVLDLKFTIEDIDIITMNCGLK